MGSLAELLDLAPGVTAVLGGGGKTTLLEALGRDLAAEGFRVVLCATAKMYPIPGLPDLVSPTEEALGEALARWGLVCAGEPVPGTGKRTAPRLPMKRLAALADYVLAEADGSAGRPLKAHAPHEPPVPPEAGQAIYVVGASGFGRPIREAAHRPELYAQRAGVSPEALAGPELEAAVRLVEGLPDRVLVNQAESPEALRAAAALAERLPCPVAAGSLRRKEFVVCG